MAIRSNDTEAELLLYVRWMNEQLQKVSRLDSECFVILLVYFKIMTVIIYMIK